MWSEKLRTQYPSPFIIKVQTKLVKTYDSFIVEFSIFNLWVYNTFKQHMKTSNIAPCRIPPQVCKFSSTRTACGSVVQSRSTNFKDCRQFDIKQSAVNLRPRGVHMTNCFTGNSSPISQKQ